MSLDASALVYIGSHNEVDQISPILYQLGKRGNITVDVVLDGLNQDRLDVTRRIDLGDYRVQSVNQYDNVRFVQRNLRESQTIDAGRLLTSLKSFGYRLPTNVPKKTYQRLVMLYNQMFQSDDHSGPKRLRIPDELIDNEYDIVALDWGRALASKTDMTSVVLPHGDSPYINPMIKQSQFDRFINDDSNFVTCRQASETGCYYNIEALAEHNYLMFPNRITANRMPQSIRSDKIIICGSPRYNMEWLDILSKIRPNQDIAVDGEINIVFFLRSENDVFITKSEIKNTLLLLSKFESIHTIIKEHPRGRLLERTAADDMKNIDIVGQELASSSLIQWGDIFLSVGTSITFEPIMRKKPVIEIEYAHANHSVVSDYFPRADVRHKKQLYDTVFDLLENGTNEYYNDDKIRKFINEMIVPSNSSVLDSWAKFIESKAQ